MLKRKHGASWSARRRDAGCAQPQQLAATATLNTPLHATQWRHGQQQHCYPCAPPRWQLVLRLAEGERARTRVVAGTALHSRAFCSQPWQCAVFFHGEARCGLLLVLSTRCRGRVTAMLLLDPQSRHSPSRLVPRSGLSWRAPQFTLGDQSDLGTAFPQLKAQLPPLPGKPALVAIMLLRSR